MPRSPLVMVISNVPKKKKKLLEMFVVVFYRKNRRVMVSSSCICLKSILYPEKNSLVGKHVQLVSKS